MADKVFDVHDVTEEGFIIGKAHVDTSQLATGQGLLKFDGTDIVPAVEGTDYVKPSSGDIATPVYLVNNSSARVSYSKDRSVVTVTFGFNMQNYSPGQVIATIPSGYRPPDWFTTPLTASDTGQQCNMIVGADGNVKGSFAGGASGRIAWSISYNL